MGALVSGKVNGYCYCVRLTQQFISSLASRAVPSL